MSKSSVIFPPGGPMPSRKVTALFMKRSFSSMTSQADMGATKSSGLRHLICMASQSSVSVSREEALGGLTG